MTKLDMILICGVVLPALLAPGCSLDTPDPATLDRAPVGAERFSDYVAIGNSLTAGFMDGGLVKNGQDDSYPRLMASMMGYAAGEFHQPLVAFPGVGSSETDDPEQIAGVIYYDGMGLDVAGPTHEDDAEDLLLDSQHPIPYGNLAVPGAMTWDVGNALDSGTSESGENPLFDAILRNPTFGDVVMRDQAIALGPKLITCWIGNNDILGGATGGEPEVGVDVTPTPEFEDLFTALLDDLSAGVVDRYGYEPAIFVGNIPGIGSAPYFIPKDDFDNDWFGVATTTEETDVVYVRLPALSYFIDGGTLPLPAEYTLDAGEVDVVETAVAEFNDVIAAAVAARDNVWLYDANTALADIAGTPEASHFLALTPTLGVEGAAATTYFSLDGIHPNNRGYGLVANGFIDVINAALGTDLPQVDIDGLTWDPTYGMLAKREGPLVTPEAAAAMDAIFR